LVNIVDSSKATYSIPYTSEELKLLTVKMTGDAYDTELEFGYDTVRIKRTRNPFKRWWGGLCGEIAGWSLKQNDKYGDYYLILDEEYTNKKIAELEMIDLG
jgi:hypothetical protein